MTKPINLRPKEITIYVTSDQYDQQQELVRYYSQGASKASASSVIRFAVDMLYHSLLKELSEKG
jgi:hypothetical protein